MTVEQHTLLKALAYTRDLMSQHPNELVHQSVYKSLIKQLRDTFCVVASTPETKYAYSPSRAVLKRVD